MFVGTAAIGVGGPALAGEIADGVVIIIMAVGSADGIQPVQFIVGNSE